MKESFKKDGHALPKGVHRCVMERAEAIAGGYGQWVWTLAALLILGMKEEILRQNIHELRQLLTDNEDVSVARHIPARILRGAALADIAEALEKVRHIAQEEALEPPDMDAEVAL